MSFAILYARVLCSRGYTTLNPDTGMASWYGDVLKKPTLPLMDIYGDVIGTDGHNLVMFEPDGKIVKPQIYLRDKLYPTFRYKKNITIFLFHYIHELYLYIIMNDLYFIFLV